MGKKKGKPNPSGSQSTSSEPQSQPQPRPQPQTQPEPRPQPQTQPQSQQQSVRARARPKNQEKKTQGDAKTHQEQSAGSSTGPKQQSEQSNTQASGSELWQSAEPKPRPKKQENEKQHDSNAPVSHQGQYAGTAWLPKSHSNVPVIPHSFESQPQSVWGPKQQSGQGNTQSATSFSQPQHQSQQQSARVRPQPKKQEQTQHDYNAPPVSHQGQHAGTSVGTSTWLTKGQSNVPGITHPFESQPQSAWSTKQQSEQANPQSSTSFSQPQQQSTKPRPRPKKQEHETQHDYNPPPVSHQGQHAGTSAWLPKSQSNVPVISHPFESQPQSAWGTNQQPEQAKTQSSTSLPQAQSQSQTTRGKQRPLSSQQENQSQRQDQDIENIPISDLSLSSSVSSSSKSSSVIPTSALIPLTQNKGSGTKGRHVKVDVNFLPLMIDKLLKTVYQYDVSIEPNLPKRFLPRVFETYRQKNFRDIFIAFDGQKIAVSPQILQASESIEKETKVIDENGRERVYMVAMKEARDREIDFSSLRNYSNMRQFDAPLRAMQMLEIVLKSPFLNKTGVQAGRSFYMAPSPSNRFDLGDNYELWTGLYQATVLGSRPYLNVDIAHKAFPSPVPVTQILLSMRNVDLRKELSSRDRSALQSHLNGLMINYTLPGNDASRRSYKFLGLNPNSKTFKFKHDQQQREYILVDYFRSRGLNLQYPFLPTLKLGNAIKNITVPLEFCSIAGNQAVNKKCTENQTRNMIRVAATTTDERKLKIMNMLSRIAHNQSPALNQFGISVGSEFTNVPARILEAPTLEYRNSKTVLPSKGQWRIDRLEFLQPKNLTRFAVLVTDRSVTDVRNFCKAVTEIGRSIGMQIDSQYSTYNLDAFSRTINDDMYSCMSDLITKNVELLFCVIPDRGDTYSKVKQCAELECGILTQCIKSSTLMRKGTDQSTVSNILLKVNAKLNGINHKLAPKSLPPLMKQPFMLVGADVTHPSPGQEHIPSVVGVVSSHDIHGFQYNKCWRLQDPKKEIIDDFDNILREHLEFFEKQRKCLPKVILYFRDGVSEGQFQQVLTTELNAMYRGCQAYKSGYKPNITFIVVQKRHHTRFFPPKGSTIGDPKNNNVPPGTIVDTEITHPNESQFYLVSHQSIQGVARPTKYCLLRDDSNFSIDELQALTFSLCHFFARCTRSVSYPAPTYYAHLAAARGRVYIEGRQINMAKLDREFKDRTVKDKIIKNHPMYFI